MTARQLRFARQPLLGRQMLCSQPRVKFGADALTCEINLHSVNHPKATTADAILLEPAYLRKLCFIPINPSGLCPRRRQKREKKSRSIRRADKQATYIRRLEDLIDRSRFSQLTGSKSRHQRYTPSLVLYCPEPEKTLNHSTVGYGIYPLFERRSECTPALFLYAQPNPLTLGSLSVIDVSN